MFLLKKGCILLIFNDVYGKSNPTIFEGILESEYILVQNMSFHTIHRRPKYPRRADQSAMCTINRHLLYDLGLFCESS